MSVTSIDPVEVVVLGGGHAGIEAASAAARMGCSVALVTMDPQAIGRMSCNPAIGGTAKAHLVHEVDALGGVMGELADRTGIQFRVLNRSKGPAVWSNRCQSDRNSYAHAAYEYIKSLSGVRIVTGTIVAADLASDDEKSLSAVVLEDGRRIACRALVIASGTFLDAVMYTGLEPTAGGRIGESAAVGLGSWLAKAGLVTHRLKTGTPPRLYRDSIDFDVCTEQLGDSVPQPFSGRTDRSRFPSMPQVSCHIVRTTSATHAVLRSGFNRSPIFTGKIAGRGPRYCPSIEDKLVRFADRQQHQLFIEPDGLDSDLIYLNGFSTSLPREVQAAALATIPGLERVRMARPGYAVEYESVPAYQLGPTLQSRAVQGLFLAGQVCGTSGYEEAAALGLVAGINAACLVQGRESFTLSRSEAYIGVMIDDLTTKEWHEPYRIFTSRAEHRLVLRQDNAERRLARYGHQLGLVDDGHYQRITTRAQAADDALRSIETGRISPKTVEDLLRASGTTSIKTPVSLSSLACRPEVPFSDLIVAAAAGGVLGLENLLTDTRLREQVAVELRYVGYIRRERRLIARQREYEAVRIPEVFDYSAVRTLSAEAKETLVRIRPVNIGQASRVAGVTPADLNVLRVALHR